jgi:hypothetical protein
MESPLGGFAILAFDVCEHVMKSPVCGREKERADVTQEPGKPLWVYDR